MARARFRGTRVSLGGAFSSLKLRSFGFEHFGPGSRTHPSSTSHDFCGSEDVAQRRHIGLVREQTCRIFAQ